MPYNPPKIPQLKSSINKTSGKLGRNQQRKGTWDRLGSSSLESCPSKRSQAPWRYWFVPRFPLVLVMANCPLEWTRIKRGFVMVFVSGTFRYQESPRHVFSRVLFVARTATNKVIPRNRKYYSTSSRFWGARSPRTFCIASNTNAFLFSIKLVSSSHRSRLYRISVASCLSFRAYLSVSMRAVTRFWVFAWNLCHYTVCTTRPPVILSNPQWRQVKRLRSP